MQLEVVFWGIRCWHAVPHRTLPLPLHHTEHYTAIAPSAVLLVSLLDHSPIHSTVSTFLCLLPPRCVQSCLKADLDDKPESHVHDCVDWSPWRSKAGVVKERIGSGVAAHNVKQARKEKPHRLLMDSLYLQPHALVKSMAEQPRREPDIPIVHHALLWTLEIATVLEPIEVLGLEFSLLDELEMWKECNSHHQLAPSVLLYVMEAQHSCCDLVAVPNPIVAGFPIRFHLCCLQTEMSYVLLRLQQLLRQSPQQQSQLHLLAQELETNSPILVHPPLRSVSVVWMDAHSVQAIHPRWLENLALLIAQIWALLWLKVLK
jgi:hypothetical protein